MSMIDRPTERREAADERLMPPHNIEAERAILGGLLLDPEALERVAQQLPPDAFYLLSHKIAYRACLALAQRDLPCDLIHVANFLHEQEQLERAGGRLGLAGLLEGSLSSANIDYYADLVRDKWRRRQLGALGRRLLEMQHSAELWPQMLSQAEQGLMALATGESGRQGLRSLEELQIEVFSEIEKRAAGEIPPGIPSHFYDLDAMIGGGFQRGDLVIVAGRPSMGKTAFVLGTGRNIAALNKLPVAFFSLEMGDKQLVRRLNASESEIDSGRLLRGQIASHEWETLGHAAASLSAMPIFIDDNSQPSLAHIQSQCRRMRSRCGQIGMVIIDYLQLMDGDSDERENVSESIAKLTRKLKGLARELDCPVVVLSQLNRGVEARMNKRPMMSDLRSSGSIEQDADLVLMLYREEYYDPETVDRGIAEVIVTKNRNGPTGTIKLLFEPQFTRFRNLAGRY